MHLWHWVVFLLCVPDEIISSFFEAGLGWTVQTAYLGISRRSGWWDVWVVRWQPADQTPYCCAPLPDTAPPSSWNSRSGLWFGKPADLHLAGNQQGQDGSLDEQREVAAKPLVFNFQEKKDTQTHTNRFSSIFRMQKLRNISSRVRSLNERMIIMWKAVLCSRAQVKNKLLLKNKSFWSTFVQNTKAV